MLKQIGPILRFKIVIHIMSKISCTNVNSTSKNPLNNHFFDTRTNNTVQIIEAYRNNNLLKNCIGQTLKETV